MNLSISLGLQLRGTPCRAFSKDTKVRCGPYRSHTREGLYAYPDLVVVCGPSQYHDQAQDVLLNPTVIVEVLSPSTEAFDRGDKFHRYRRWLPTLTDYVLVAQDRPVIDHYQRTPTGLLLRRSSAVGVGDPRRPRRPPAPAQHQLHGAAGRGVRAHRVPSGRGGADTMMAYKGIAHG